MKNFGNYIKKKRLDAGLSSRAFIQKNKLDPSKWHKLEAGLIWKKSINEEDLKEISTLLNLTNYGTKKLNKLFKDSEDYIMDEGVKYKHLPVILCHPHKKGFVPTEQQLVELSRIIFKSLDNEDYHDKK